MKKESCQVNSLENGQSGCIPKSPRTGRPIFLMRPDLRVKALFMAWFLGDLLWVISRASVGKVGGRLDWVAILSKAGMILGKMKWRILIRFRGN